MAGNEQNKERHNNTSWYEISALTVPEEKAVEKLQNEVAAAMQKYSRFPHARRVCKETTQGLNENNVDEKTHFFASSLLPALKADLKEKFEQYKKAYPTHANEKYLASIDKIESLEDMDDSIAEADTYYKKSGLIYTAFNTLDRAEQAAEEELPDGVSIQAPDESAEPAEDEEDESESAADDTGSDQEESPRSTESGPRWKKYTPEQRVNFTQRYLDGELKGKVSAAGFEAVFGKKPDDADKAAVAKAVEDVQNGLNEKGAGLVPDGIFGPLTYKALHEKGFTVGGTELKDDAMKTILRDGPTPAAAAEAPSAPAEATPPAAAAPAEVIEETFEFTQVDITNLNTSLQEFSTWDGAKENLWGQMVIKLSEEYRNDLAGIVIPEGTIAHIDKDTDVDLKKDIVTLRVGDRYIKVDIDDIEAPTPQETLDHQNKEDYAILNGIIMNTPDEKFPYVAQPYVKHAIFLDDFAGNYQEQITLAPGSVVHILAVFGEREPKRYIVNDPATGTRGFMLTASINEEDIIARKDLKNFGGDYKKALAAKAKAAKERSAETADA